MKKEIMPEPKYSTGNWSIGKRVPFKTPSGVDNLEIQINSTRVINLASAWGDDEEAEANAKLISAAPDMIIALQAAERRLESLQTYFTSQNFTDRYGDADANAGCLLAIKDAIKKATA